MDSIFSPKLHTHSLISISPISSSLIPRRPPSLRHEFLHNNLRLRSRRKCIGFRFGAHSSRFVLKASLDSQAVVVAAVVTISALTIVLFEFSKRNSNFNEISAELILALRRQIRHVMNWFPRHVFALINIQEEKSVKNLVREVSKVGNECEDGGTDVQHGLTQTFVTNKIESPDTNQLASSSSGSLAVGTPGSDALAQSDTVPSSYTAESHNYLQEHLQGTKLRNSLTTEEVGSEPSVALFPETNINRIIEETKTKDPELMTKDGLKAHKHVAEGEVNIHDLIFRDFARKELYTFFETSTKSLNGQGTFISHDSLQRSSVFSPTTKVSSRAEAFEEKTPRGYYKGGPFSTKDFGKRKQHFTTNKEKIILPVNGATKQFQSPNPKGIQVCDGPRPSDQFRAYRHFLREGRLMDCIEMLEDMERNGSLNMDKVYHAGFFQVCKSQKAVKEAFHFTKLIQNPTLSTFNMLLSVCASSRDLEGAFRVIQLVRDTGLKPDCKLYTTLIATCAKAGKVDTMFEL